MDFFNKLGKKASETYQVTKEKTAKFSSELKLKGKINEAKNKIADLYKEIGEIVYTQYKTNLDEGKNEIEEKCAEISRQFDEIAKLETEILALKEVKKCVECKQEINTKDDFCSKCGKEQPHENAEEKVEVKQETEVQEAQDAEVINIEDAKSDQNYNNE